MDRSAVPDDRIGRTSRLVFLVRELDMVSVGLPRCLRTVVVAQAEILLAFRSGEFKDPGIVVGCDRIAELIRIVVELEKCAVPLRRAALGAPGSVVS
jgi:hypothetical protein